jgi:hypothetical protein
MNISQREKQTFPSLKTDKKRVDSAVVRPITPTKIDVSVNKKATYIVL